MVVQSRKDVGRNRLLYILTIILSVAALVTAVLQYSDSSDGMRAVLLLLAGAALLAIVVSMIQLYGLPKRSKVLLVFKGEEMIIATNATHEGFKFRFIRDVLSENMVNFSDADRERWKFLEEDGYFPALCIKNPKKLLVLRLCTMVFDDVYFVDSTNRWEHHDSSSTSEPTFSTPEKPELRGWKGTVSQS
ncbi:MAG TPA: hypothetical protein VK210_13475 [Terriglobia bacterium]|nr:hypothetical protein [Terriglobia bacterium]